MVAGNVTVSGTSAAQTVELRGMTLTAGDLSLNSCLGSVLLYQCIIGDGNFSGIGTLRATRCMRVHADGCTLGTGLNSQPAVVLVNAQAVLRNCSIPTVLSGACDVQSSSLQLTDCGVGVFTLVSAIQVTSGDVGVIGGSIAAGGLARFNGTGTARVDPSVYSYPPLFAPSVQGTIVDMPAVVTTGGGLGGTLTVSMRGPGGQVGGLVAGFPGVPYLVPGIRDAIWLQPGTEVVCFLTTCVRAVPVQVTTNVPNSAALRGLRVAWQGITYGASAGLQASTPAITSHW